MRGTEKTKRKANLIRGSLLTKERLARASGTVQPGCKPSGLSFWDLVRKIRPHFAKHPIKRGTLGFFQAGILLDKLLLTIARKTDRDFGLVAQSFAPQNQPTAVFGVSNVRAGKEKIGCWVLGVGA